MKLRDNLTGSMKYRSFIPAPLEDYRIDVNPDRIHELDPLFNELNVRLTDLPDDARLDLIGMEAEDSWRLADDRPSNSFSFAKDADNINVKNIVKATLYAAEALEELPVSTRLIRNIHYLICAGEDYDRSYRGEYRKSPVWIGRPGGGLADASFVPPVAEDMTAAVTDLDKYINYSDDNVFVKAAVIHYRFEMIHPFLDGNGRTGRLLNNIFLTETRLIPSPALLLSHIIARDYNRYCSEIQYTNFTGDISTWTDYWLNILAESCRYTLRIVADNN